MPPRRSTARPVPTVAPGSLPASGRLGLGPAARPGADCLPLHEVLPAAAYLRTLAASRGVGLVRDEPVPELAELQRNLADGDRQTDGQRHTRGDMARARLRYEIAGRPVGERMTVTTVCSEATLAAVGRLFNCSAMATRVYAPLGEPDALLPTSDAMRLTLNGAWMQRWNAAMQQKVAARTQQQSAALLQQGQVAQAARMQNHQAFMNGMAQARDARNLRFQEGQ